MNDIFEKIKILFEDESFLVINKPAGLLVHPDERSLDKTLSDFLKEKYPEFENIGRPHTLDNERYVPRYGMLTRLDKDASGIILIAKNESVFEELSKIWSTKKVVKEYLISVYGNLNSEIKNLISKDKIKEIGNNLFLIDAPIGRSKVDPRKWTSGTDIRNTKREAKTQFEIVNTLEKEFGEVTNLKVWPVTGRTHQIRVHFYFLGFPVVGDRRYHKFPSDLENEDFKSQNKILNLELKATKISFPWKGEIKTFEI